MDEVQGLTVAILALVGAIVGLPLGLGLGRLLILLYENWGTKQGGT